jgi:pilus assembly protein Flp/PilA
MLEMKLLNNFLRDEQGQDLVEYALLIGLITLVCVLALTASGTAVSKIFSKITDTLTTAAG